MFAEPLLTRWPLNKLVREKALKLTMKHIHYEDENSRYITVGCVEKVIISIIIFKNKQILYIEVEISTKRVLKSLMAINILIHTYCIKYILLGFMHASMLGGRSKWRCFQETSCKASRLLMDFRGWNDHAGILLFFSISKDRLLLRIEKIIMRHNLHICMM
jgi:hypothetical protein